MAFFWWARWALSAFVGFMVATRTREIAVRMAPGSARLPVFGLMMSDLVKLVIPGIAGGLVLAAVLIRTMEDVMGTPLTLVPICSASWSR